LNRKLAGPQGPSGRGGDEKNLFPSPRVEAKALGNPTRSPLLYWLSYPGSLTISVSVKLFRTEILYLERRIQEKQQGVLRGSSWEN
jgi:hypothetical protein